MSTQTDSELRKQVGIRTEAVFLHSIALSHGMTHEDAADEIMQLIEADRRKRVEQAIELGYGLGAQHELERSNCRMDDEFFERQAEELAQLSRPNTNDREEKP